MAVPCFEDARKTLSDLLGNLTFLKVVCVQHDKGAYTGEAVELSGQKRLAFFDKFGRSRSYLNVGPITLTQAAMGFDHPSSVPSVGEVIVGTVVPNTRKSHLTIVVRGWSSDAKPLFELARMVKFGTKKSELENRNLLIQPAGLLPQGAHFRDEIYVLARIVLWRNLRPLQVLAHKQTSMTLKEPATEAELSNNLCISMPAKQFAETVAIKLSSPDILEAFLDGFLGLPPPPDLVRHGASNAAAQAYGPYVPRSPEVPPAGHYVPTSPAYNPTSPQYSFE